MDEIMQYLLGILPEEAQQRVEQRLLTDEDFFEELLAGEDELTDLYLNEDLSSEDRDRFESHFLSTPERHRQLKFAKALSRYVSEKYGFEKSEDAVGTLADTPPTPVVFVPPTELTVAERLRAFWNSQAWALHTAVALGLIAIIAGTAWVSFWFPLFRTPTPRTFATLTLAASASNRGEGAQAAKVKLPPAASALRISLTLPAGATPAANYRVEWSVKSGRPIPLDIVGQDAQSVSVEIPADKLAPRLYVLKLLMLDAAGTEQRVDHYFFTVE